MSLAKKGDTVKVHYTGKLDDGTVFDSSRSREPFSVKLGDGRVIPGFENGIVGMEQGQTKTVTIPPEEGYGPRRDNLVLEVNESEFPKDITPEVGQKLQLKQANGQNVPVTITAINNNIVTLDANHPLAGQTLTFEIELLEVA